MKAILKFVFQPILHCAAWTTKWHPSAIRKLNANRFLIRPACRVPRAVYSTQLLKFSTIHNGFTEGKESDRKDHQPNCPHKTTFERSKQCVGDTAEYDRTCHGQNGRTESSTAMSFKDHLVLANRELPLADDVRSSR